MNDVENLPQETEQVVLDIPVNDDTWPASTTDQLPADLVQAQAIQKELEEQHVASAPVIVKQEKVFKTPQESFSELKKAKLQADRERDEALRRLQEFESRKSIQQEEDNSFSIAPDEIAEGKHLSKVQNQIVQLKKQIQENERRSAEIALEAKLKAQYPDFDAIVKADNIELLKQNDPESALIIDSIPNIYTKALAAYKAIKAMNVNQAQEDIYAADRAKAQANAAKPRPAVSISPQTAESPLSRVNAFAEGLTPELQKQLLKEMAEARQR